MNNDDLKVVVKAVLEADERASAKKIQSQLQSISKMIQSKQNVKIGLEIDRNSALNQVKLLANQIQSQAEAVRVKNPDTSFLKKIITELEQEGVAGFTASLVREVRQSVGELMRMDTILTEISKTSDRTSESLRKLGQNAFDTASQYGRKASDYLLGVQEMSRAGFGDKQSEALSELSVLAQSAGGMTAELANRYLIATNAAYGYHGSVEKLNAVLDGQNQITNRNALDMSELAQATKIVASQAAQSGVSIEEMTAAVGTMIATTQQGGEIAARAFKGILMNLQQVSGELDGEVIDEESFKKVEKRLHGVGVSISEIVDGSVRLRDPIAILRELAAVYNALPDNDVEKAGIISDLGGKYRGGQLSSLLSNWDTFEKMLSDYQGATGSALQEAEKSANSWEGKLNRLSNTWTDFVNNFIDSDLAKTVLDIGNAFAQSADLITGFSDSVGALPLLAGTLAGVLSAKSDFGILNMPLPSCPVGAAA